MSSTVDWSQLRKESVSLNTRQNFPNCRGQMVTTLLPFSKKNSWSFLPFQQPSHFSAPLHKKATWKYYLYSLSPILYWIHFSQAFASITLWMSLNKVTNDFYVAKSNDRSSVLILLDLSTHLAQFIASSSWKYSLARHHTLWVFLLPHWLFFLSLLVLQFVLLYFGVLQGTPWLLPLY